MRYLTIDNKLFVENRNKFCDLLPKNSVAIFYSNDQQPRNGDQFFKFRQQSDFFYLTGIDQEKSILVIYKNESDEKLKEILFLLKTNPTIAIWEGHKYSKNEATNVSGISDVFWVDSFDSSIKEILSETNNIYLNRNEYPKFFSEVEDRNHRLGNELKTQYPLHSYHRSAPLLAHLRMIKSGYEIELLQKACEITNKAFRKVLSTIKPGDFEFEVQAEIEYVFTRNRANGHGYEPIIASGKNACVLHYIENDKLCKDGDLVLFDFGAEYANYTADMSRTIPVNGSYSVRQKECYNAVLKVFKEIRKLYVVGNTINLINERVNKLMEKEMVKLNLFTEEDIENQDTKNPLFKKYFMHGTAHFLGLDVHDVGGKDEKFKPGMVLTCEPGIYIPEENIGIRIENDILITDNESVDLMQDIPIEADEIEMLMKLRNK